MEGWDASLKATSVNGCPSQVPTLYLRKQQRLGLLPALVAMSKQILQKKRSSCYLYIAMSTQILKKKRTKDPVCSYLKKLISPYGFGWKGDDGVGRFRNETLIRYYNTSGFMDSPTNSELHDHFAGQETLYFWADGRKSVPLTISMIDIDCHKSGNPESAKAFADWLNDNYFPCLYHEPSTNGKGRHGYFVLFKEGFIDVAVANILKRLEKALKKLLTVFLAAHPEHQVENVEIKGTPHIITWVKGERRKIESMKSGALAKVPRDILTRFDEFKDTTVLSFDDIDDLESQAEKLVIPEPPKLLKFKGAGSTSAHPITKDEIEAINGPYLDFAKTWVLEPVGTSSRAKVEAADLAIALPIVKYCSQKRNADGTMPTRRIKVIWDRLFAEGEIDRAFDYHRWRVIRNLIEVQGGLEIEDRYFYTGFVNDQGEVIKGLAAKWKMADWLIEKLDEMVELGYQQEVEEIANNESVSTSLQKELQSNQAEVSASSLMKNGGGALLEQNEYQEAEDLFDKNWIIEFRRSMPPMIGLIWGGSIQNIRRDAG
jgi:hypothetical protein